MHVRILLQFTGHDDSPGAAAEIAAFEKTVERPEDLGLSLAEGKALTAAIQKRVVEAQVASWAERHRCCGACGVRRRSKGSYARGVAHYDAAEGARLLKSLERIKWLLWHGNQHRAGE